MIKQPPGTILTFEDLQQLTGYTKRSGVGGHCVNRESDGSGAVTAPGPPLKWSIRQAGKHRTTSSTTAESYEAIPQAEA